MSEGLIAMLVLAYLMGEGYVPLWLYGIAVIVFICFSRG